MSASLLEWNFDPCASGGRMRAFLPDPKSGRPWDVWVYPDGSWHLFDPERYTPPKFHGRKPSEREAMEEAERILVGWLRLRDA